MENLSLLSKGPDVIAPPGTFACSPRECVCSQKSAIASCPWLRWTIKEASNLRPQRAELKNHMIRMNLGPNKGIGRCL